ncbi:MAG: (2Fe-2S) ferredoxin domain-containing protein [Cyanobacteria bacterium P01_D01_bin.1]
MAGLSAAHFCWTGKFSAFASGNKSPYQYLVMTVLSAGSSADLSSGLSPVDRADGVPLEIAELYQIRLSKALQQMMYGYLAPQDWIRVAGKCRADRVTGEQLWQASEIVKLSSAQVLGFQEHIHQKGHIQKNVLEKNVLEQRVGVDNVGRSGRAAESNGVEKPVPVRVLVCQQSGCRQRGSAQVSQAVAEAIARSPHQINITLTATGCLKNCKLGPNMVVVSSHQNSRTKSARHTRVTPKAASEIIKTISSAH